MLSLSLLTLMWWLLYLFIRRWPRISSVFTIVIFMLINYSSSSARFSHDCDYCCWSFGMIIAGTLIPLWLYSLLFWVSSLSDIWKVSLLLLPAPMFCSLFLFVILWLSIVILTVVIEYFYWLDCCLNSNNTHNTRTSSDSSSYNSISKSFTVKRQQHWLVKVTMISIVWAKRVLFSHSWYDYSANGNRQTVIKNIGHNSHRSRPSDEDGKAIAMRTMSLATQMEVTRIVITMDKTNEISGNWRMNSNNNHNIVVMYNGVSNNDSNINYYQKQHCR